VRVLSLLLFLSHAALTQDPDLAAAGRALASSSLTEREQAFRALQNGGERARPILQRLQSDPDPEVRARARQLLEHLDVPPLLKKLRSRDVLARTAARAKLFERGKPAAAAYLKKHADDRLVPLLTDIIHFEPDPAIRKPTLTLLTSLGPPQSLPAFAWALRGTLGHNSTLLETIAKQGNLTIIPDLKARAERVPGDKPKVDAAMAAILVRHPPGVPPKELLADPGQFLTWLKGKSVPHRVLAIRATVTGMTWMDAPRAAVAAALAPTEPLQVRRAAAEAMSFLEATYAHTPLLLAAEKDPDQRVRVFATVALGKLDDDLVRTFLLRRASNGKTEQDRRAAISALAGQGDARSLEGLAKLAPKDPRTRKQLTDTLKRIGDRLAKKG